MFFPNTNHTNCTNLARRFARAASGVIAFSLTQTSQKTQKFSINAPTRKERRLRRREVYLPKGVLHKETFERFFTSFNMTNYALDNIHIITQINLILLNICLAQLRKHKFFLNIRSLIFGISLALHYL